MSFLLTPSIPKKNIERVIEPILEIKKIQLPSPIVVKEIDEYNKFSKLLSQHMSKDRFTIIIVNKNNIKFSTIDENTYRNVAKTLRKQTPFTWFTCEDKKKKPVVAKNLVNSCQPDNIVDDLVNRGLYARNPKNKIKLN